jgi:phosphotransferase system enzyme I (PtsI)
MEQATAQTERRIPAIILSLGIGTGQVVFFEGEKPIVARVDLQGSEIDAEIARFRSAVRTAAAELSLMARSNATNMPASEIFGAHLLMLNESSFAGRVETRIERYKVNAEFAVVETSRDFSENQGAASDRSFQERSQDVEDVAQRLLRALTGSAEREAAIGPHTIVVARELRPSAIVEIARHKPAGVITERGGWTSHTSILGREFKLPMVSGIKDVERLFAANDDVIVDAINGEVIIDPCLETIERARSLSRERPFTSAGNDRIPRTLITRDGTEVTIRANADSRSVYENARQLGAHGIGLFRSESLIARPGVIPTEDQQFAIYQSIAEAAGEERVRIRTFDIGVDSLADSRITPERNPSLGLRSIRLSLANEEMFRAQIRALLRASAGNNLDIILPMVTGIVEVKRTRTIIDEEREKLSQAGIDTGDPALGAMIEVPSAVLTVREIAANTDFLCLGTNDLIQYLLAADRDNDSIADWYQTLHPAVIRAIEQVFVAANDAGIPATVAGEMAGSAFYVPLLIGLGARELSMNLNSIQPIRNLISSITIADAVELAELVKTSTTAEATEQILRTYYLTHWDDLFPPGLLDRRHR